MPSYPNDFSDDEPVTMPRWAAVNLWNYAMEYLDPGDRWDENSVTLFREVARALGEPADEHWNWETWGERE